MVHNNLSIFVLSIVFLAKFIDARTETPDIQISKGKIRGEILRTVDSDQEYSSFKSIPFAKPPIGYGYRFRRPVPMDPWEGTLVTQTDPPACPYWRLHLWDYYRGNEDCLYLNVYTPETDFTSPGSRAVMVFIHGGAFQWDTIASSQYGPDFLIEKDVVVVLMNYRLGIFGFLSLGIPQFHNNVGLWDQVEALKWVQDNIAKFGGDPKKVTIFGESAGGVSVEFLKLAPQHTKGLFRSSIAMSGSALNIWGIIDGRRAAERGRYVLDYLLYFWWNNEDLYRKMSRMSMERLLDAAWSTMLTYMDPMTFTPTIEYECCSDNPFITKRPEEIYRSRNFIDAPHILGFMKDEGLAFLGATPCLAALLGNGITRSLVHDINNFEFIEGIDRTQRYLTSYGQSPVYYYRNSFDYQQALHKVNYNNRMSGAAHGDDLAHVFWMQGRSQPLDGSSDIAKHRRKMVTMWTNFAKYLNPTSPDDSNVLDGIEWEPSGRSGRHLEIDESMWMGGRPIDAQVERMIVEKNDHFD